MTFDSSWVLAEGEYDGHSCLIRFRQIPEDFPRGKYPDHINITWRMSESYEDGLPTDPEFERMAAFENRLVDAVEPDEHSILLAALTCKGEKEFVFQTADPKGFVGRLTNMPQEKERYPITLERYDDPGWGYFNSVSRVERGSKLRR